MKLERGSNRSGAPFAIGLVIGLAVLLFVLSIRIVDQGKVCAVVQLGNVVGQARTGFQFVMPLITRLDCYDRQVTIYQTGDVQNQEADYWDVPVEIKSSDGQTAFLSFNVTYHVDSENVVKVRSEVATSMSDLKERVIANYARSIPRDLGPEYSATELYTSGRVEFENAILSRLSAKFLEYGVTLDDFTLRDVNFEEAYESAIEAQQIARERIETENYNAQAAVFEAQKVIEQAKGEAERTRIQAQADADALRIKAEAIRNNPEMLKLEFIQALKTANWMMIPWDQLQGFMPIPAP